MCLAVPGRVVSVEGATGRVDFGDGTLRKVNLILVDGVKPGDYVLVHAGYAIQTLTEEEALKTIELWEKILSLQG